MHHPCSWPDSWLGSPPPQQVSSNHPPSFPCTARPQMWSILPLRKLCSAFGCWPHLSPSPHVHRSFLAPSSPRAPEWFFYKKVGCRYSLSGWSPKRGLQAAALLGLCPLSSFLCPHSIVSSGPLTAHLPLLSWPLPLLQAGASCQAVPQLQARP